MTGRADNTIRQVSTLQAVDIPELNRILRKIQGDVSKLEGRLGQAQLRDSLNILPPPVDPAAATQDSSTLFHSITEGKLRASESRSGYGDVLNVVGAWSSSNIVTPAPATMTFSSEIVSDASTFLWNGSTQVALMRPGVYVFFYRGTVTPDAGAIRVLLHIGASTFRNQYTGAGGNVTLAESITYVNTSTTPVAVSLELTIGTSLGSANLELPTMLTIVKVR